MTESLVVFPDYPEVVFAEVYSCLPGVESVSLMRVLLSNKQTRFVLIGSV